MREPLGEIEDFLDGDYVKSFTDGETRTYEFGGVDLVDRTNYNGQPEKKLEYQVRDPNSKAKAFKKMTLSRVHKNVYYEYKNGNNGKGWTVMQLTRRGQQKNTRYEVKGIR